MLDLRALVGLTWAWLAQIYHQYVRLRKDFGRYPAFVDEGAEVRSAVFKAVHSPQKELTHTKSVRRCLLISDQTKTTQKSTLREIQLPQLLKLCLRCQSTR